MTQSITPEELKGIWEAALACTPGNLDTVPNPSNEYGGKEDDGYYECPFCHGEGSVDGITYTNFDRVAIGVQFFGIGDEPKQYENYFRAIPPAVAAAMVQEIRALKGALGRTAEALGWFLEDSRFCVGVGGNPNVVESMIAKAREIYNESRATQKGTSDV